MTTTIRSRNWARGILLSQCLFVVVGGLAITLAPEQACERMAALRGIREAAVQCPSYTGAEPVFEMYTFSLGKHQALIALVFSYFSRSSVEAKLPSTSVSFISQSRPRWMRYRFSPGSPTAIS